jgi:hypothetical protein
MAIPAFAGTGAAKSTFVDFRKRRKAQTASVSFLEDFYSL